MSGHNKWSSIKHKKAKEDSKRGAVFTKLIKELTIAARQGGGNPDTNPGLRLAIDKAREYNMPKQNIEKAIQKGIGELSGVSYEDVEYEGYGPGGVAIIIKATTDNKQRTTANLRYILSKYGGSLGENGCVSWMFDYVGYIKFDKKDINEGMLFEAAIEEGATDVKDNVDENTYDVLTEPKDLMKIRDALEKRNFKTISSELTKIPQNLVKLNGETAEKMLRLMDMLDGNEDVSDIYTNFDIPDDMLNNHTD